jgi:hypothetical protein
MEAAGSSVRLTPFASRSSPPHGRGDPMLRPFSALDIARE